MISSPQYPKRALMLPGGVANPATLVGFVPLVEASVETMSSGLANAIATRQVDDTHGTLISISAAGSKTYAELKKGTAYYTNAIAQATAAQAFAAAQGMTYRARALTVIHGESDHLIANTDYDDNLTEWQANYDADLRAISGQAAPVPLVHSQMSSWTAYSAATSVIPQLQLDASDGVRVVLVGPKYDIAYPTGTAHTNNAGYRKLGEQFAKALRALETVGSWTPLKPLSATRSGAVIDVVFAVPVAPLVLDDVSVSDPGSYGFEYTDDSSPPAISTVVLLNATTVRITLAAPPTGANKRVRYAFTGTPGNAPGPTTGARGCLRDSDATVSLYANSLWNWCVHFDMAVT